MNTPLYQKMGIFALIIVTQLSSKAQTCTGISITNTTATPTAVCAGETVTLNATLGASYQSTFTGSSATIPTEGNADPFPIPLNIVGLPTNGVTVAAVILNGLTHDSPEDLDIYLQSPAGTNIILMSDVPDNSGIDNINITLQDSGSDFPANISTGIYHPSNEIDAGPDGMPGGAALSLANFTGNYNGTWNLFMTDDNANDGGSLSSWAIVFNVPTAASGAVSYQWASNNGTTLNNNTTATPTSAPTATTTYTVTITGIGNCTATNNVTVNVTPIPTVNDPNNQSVCENTPVTVNFNGTADAAFDWANDNTNIGLSATGTGDISFNAANITAQQIATITVTPSLSGCIGNPQTFSIIVNPTPTTSIFVSENSNALPNGTTICSGESVTLVASGGSSYAWSGGLGTSQSVTDNTSAPSETYTVTVTDLNTCTATAAQTIQVNALPTVSISPANPVICAGINSTITATGTTATYTWAASNGGNIVSGGGTNAATINAAGTYTVTATSNGCTANASVTATAVSPPNAGTLIAGTNAFCNNNTTPINLFNLIDNEQTGGTWSVSPTPTVAGSFDDENGTFVPNGNNAGNYSFTYTVNAASPCTGIDTETVTVTLAAAPSAGTAATPLSACVNSTSGIDLFSLLSGETVGGAWTVGSGTPFGSTFNATSGTFTPNGNTVGTFTFTYTVTGGAGCPGIDSETVTVILTSAPSAGTAGSALSVCTTSNSPVGLFSLLSGAQSGGVWTVASGSPVSGTFSAANGTFTPLGNAVGTFTFTYTVTGGAGCAGSDSETVTVILTGAVSAGTAAAPLSACVNSTTGINLFNLLSDETTGGVWTVASGSPANGTFSAANGTFTPNGNTVGTFTFTYTVTGSGGCPGIDSETVTVILTSAPSAGTAGSALSVCTTSNSPVGLFSLLSGAQSGGVWTVASGSPVSGTFSAANGTFTPLGNAVGTFTFTYTVTGGAGCAGSDSETVTVILTGAVSAGTAAAPLSACVNSTTGINLFNLLSDETTGGVWTVASGSPANGTFSAANGTFTPNGNTVGTFTFTYTVTGSGGCPGIDSETVTVILTSAPSAGTAGSALSVCTTSNSPVGLFSLLSGAQSGGVWTVASGSPVSGTFSAANGTFTPLGNAVGTFTFTYTVTGGAGCAGSDSETVTVILTGAVSAGTAAAPLSACVNSTTGINLFNLLSDETTGGTWTVGSGTPFGSTFNATSGTFTPNGNTVGTFTFTYTVTGGAGCPGIDSETVTVILTSAPSAGTAGSALSVCNTSNSPVGLFSLLSGAQSGGVWTVASGSPVSGTFSAANGTFTPLGNAVGTFTFTYTVTGGAGCAGSDSETVTVILTGAVSAGTAAAPLSACVNSTIGINLNDLLTGETVGGAWTVASGSPANGTFSAANGTFTPNGNSVGTFTFTYTVTGSGGCPGIDSETVTVILTSAPSAGIAGSALSVCNTSNSPVGLFSLLSGAQSGGVWVVASGSPFGTTFNASSGTFTPLGNAVGTFTFTYTVTGGAGCAGSDSETVTVILTGAVSAGIAAAPLSACVNSTIGIDLFSLLSSETTGGTWLVTSGSPVGGTFNDDSGIFTPLGNSVGTFTFTYTVTGSGGCPGIDSETVTVILTSAPSAGTAGSALSVCNTSNSPVGLFSLLSGAQSGGVWVVASGSPVSGTFSAANGIFTPLGNAVGTFTFTYTVTGGAGCAGSDSETVTVILTGAVSAGTAAAPLSACVNSTIGINLNDLLTGETVGGAWTVGSGTPFGSTFNATSGTFTPNGNTVGTFTFTYTVTGSGGCPGIDSETVTVILTSAPSAGTAQSALSVCTTSNSPVGLFSLLSGAQSGGVWVVASGSPFGSTFNAANGTFTPLGNAVGTFTFTYTVTGGAGCTGNDSETVTVILTGAVSAGTAAAPLSACVNSTSSISLADLLTGETVGGTWTVASGSPIPVTGTFSANNGTFTPNGNSVGTFTFTYTVIGGIGCPGSDSQTVTVILTNAPSAGVAQSALSVCNNSNSPVGLFSLLSGAESGGVWTVASGSPVSGTFSVANGTFTPLGNAVGTFTFTYTVTGGAGCAGSDSETVTVILTGAVSAGTAAAPLSACVNSNIGINLFNLLSDETTGGVWTVASGSPVSGTFSANNGTFTPNGNSVGTFTFTYTVTGSGGCPGSDSETVTVILTSAPSAGTAQSALSVCNNSNSPVGLFSLLSGAQSGGVWTEASGSPVIGTFSASNGTFTPLGNAVGTFTFTYTVTGGAGCAGSDSETVTVILTGAVSAGTAAAPLSACVNSTTGIDLFSLLSDETSGGTWLVTSGSPVGGTFNDDSGIFTPFGNSVGTFAFTYTVTGSAGCPGSDNELVTIILTNAPSAGTAQSALSVCNNSNSPVGLFSLLSGAQSGGVWTEASGSPVIGTFSASNGTFTPLGNAVGTFTFTYTVTGGAGCTGNDSETVTVILTGAVSAGTAAAPLSACVNSNIGINLNDLLIGETIGGAWSVASGSPVNNSFDAVNGIFTPVGNAINTFTFTYTVTGSAGCPGSANETVTVILTSAPSAGTASAALSVCNNSNSPVGLFSLLSEAQSGGVWTVASGAPFGTTFNASSGTFTPLGNAVGTFTFTYTVTGGVGCSGDDSETVTVILTNAVSAGATVAPLSACVNSTSSISLADLLTNETSGGVWSLASGNPVGTTFNAANGMFTPIGNNVGNFAFTYTVTGSADCPGSDSETVTVQLVSAPNAGNALSPPTICFINTAAYPLFSLLNNADPNGTWIVSAGGNVPIAGTFNANNGTFIPNGNPEATYLFSYIVNGGGACNGTADTSNVALITSSSADVCNDCPEAPAILLKAGSDSNPVLPILICTAEEQAVLSYEWGAYIEHSTGEVDTIPLAILGTNSLQYYVRDICAERRWLAGDFSNAQSCPPLDTIGKQLNYFVTVDYIVQTVGCDTAALYQAKVSDWISEHNMRYLSPKPTAGNLQLTIQNEILGTLRLDICDLTGRCVYSVQLNKQSPYFEHPIDLQTIPQGIYIARVYLNDRIFLIDKITKF
jgi:subtilisin-like proprotein convertase family protein